MLASEVTKSNDFVAAQEEARAAGWHVEAIVDTAAHYAEMFDFVGGGREHCHSADIRVYVYPPPLYNDHGELEKMSMANLLRSGSEGYGALMNAPLQCLFGMYGTEFLYHRYFSSSSCRVMDPDVANLFFVPSYFKCIEVINYADGFNVERPGEEEGSLLFQTTASYIRQLGPWLDRYDGADHIFLFSWGRFPCQLPDWRGVTRSAIALQVEDCCQDLNFEKPQHTFSRWKDIIIPGHVDRWRVLDLRRFNLEFEKRDVLFIFHGRTSQNTESYANVTVRTRILEYEGWPGVSVGGFVEDYHELLGQSRFCLAPRGITPWTVHLYVAMLAGCIPVILSDAFELPFQDFLRWSDFSVRWPEDDVGNLYEYLATMPPQKVKQMKLAVDNYSCWFDYHSENPDCSPYTAVMKMLEKRVRDRPAFAERHWKP
eukprot:TRINITY_DN35608_c0_g2_i1.p1 TRINITY_DN35608_c0_g2~~TRINITY_DN35608_c0_g2_i1.p1  ORF type:complete len:456 (+),score=51.87 TRINITY_DN35608_c0_g2_i1:87-1370(+)